MSHLTYTVRIPPEREAETDQAIQKHLKDFPDQGVDDAIDHLFAIGVIYRNSALFNPTASFDAEKWKDENL